MISHWELKNELKSRKDEFYNSNKFSTFNQPFFIINLQLSA